MQRSYAWVWKLLISLAIIFMLWRLVDVQLLAESFKHVNTTALVLVIILVPINLGLRAFRFSYIINSKRKLISYIDSYGITLAGEALNIILPASTGDFAKAYYGYKKHNIKEEMVSATLLDKITGLLGLLILGTITAWLHGYTVLAIVFCIAGIILAAFTFIPKLIPWQWFTAMQKRMKRGVFDVQKLHRSFASKMSVKIGAVIISIVAWIASYALLYAITQVFNLNISILFLFSVAPLINLSRLLPFVWSGLGVQEGVTTYLFSLAGIAPTFAIVVSLMYTICAIIIPGLFGLFLILRLKKMHKE